MNKSKSNRFSREVRERAVRMVLEYMNAPPAEAEANYYRQPCEPLVQ